MQTRMIIILSGHMGTGKTTLSKILLKHLNAMGIKAKYSYISSFHFLVYYLNYLLLRVRFPSSFVKLFRKTGIHPLSLNSYLLRRIINVLIMLEVFSLSTIYLLKVILPLKLRLKDVIVVDEGPIHTIAAYLALINELRQNSGKNRVGRGKFLIYVALKLVLHVKKHTRIKTYYLCHNSSNELIQSIRRRGYPPFLEYAISYNKVFDYAKEFVEKSINLEIKVFNISKEGYATILNNVLNDITNSSNGVG
ncbi:hypothetical protein ACSU1N_02275 [Thermogladius sp. 4427co]|uniref:ATP-binding protein n=1 Tax=Thermogladius sp. 4427co TaxID=3450718 RepID=UPI003F7A6C93